MINKDTPLFITYGQLLEYMNDQKDQVKACIGGGLFADAVPQSADNKLTAQEWNTLRANLLKLIDQTDLPMEVDILSKFLTEHKELTDGRNT